MGEMKTASHKKLLRSSKTAYTKIEEPKKVASPASSPSPSINCLQNYLIYHRGTILLNILRNGFSFSKKIASQLKLKPKPFQEEQRPYQTSSSFQRYLNLFLKENFLCSFWQKIFKKHYASQYFPVSFTETDKEISIFL